MDDVDDYGFSAGGFEVKMPCENARSLVPSYLDGELSEEQAAPLRSHLFDCPSCRETAKEGTALRRWFQAAADEPVEVPEGFAPRVARRAFAGDPGVLVPHGPAGTARDGAILPFVLKLSVVAAGLLFAFSIAIRVKSLPEGNRLDALQKEPWEEPVEWVDGTAPAPDDAKKPADEEEDEEE